MSDHTPTCIQTYSRKMLDLARPDPADVDFRDVALGLARCARFAGQTRRRYSVAEHSIRVAQVARETLPEARLAALLHDVHEAYLGDWSTPLKRLLADLSEDGREALRRTEEKVWGAIWTRVITTPGARWNHASAQIDEAVKHADLVLLSTEARDLLPWGPVDDWTRDLPPALDKQIETNAWSCLDDLAWAEWWLAHVEDAAGLAPGALAPLDCRSRSWNNRPYLGVVARARVWMIGR